MTSEGKKQEEHAFRSGCKDSDCIFVLASNLATAHLLLPLAESGGSQFKLFK